MPAVDVACQPYRKAAGQALATAGINMHLTENRKVGGSTPPLATRSRKAPDLHKQSQGPSFCPRDQALVIVFVAAFGCNSFARSPLKIAEARSFMAFCLISRATSTYCLVTPILVCPRIS